MRLISRMCMLQTRAPLIGPDGAQHMAVSAHLVAIGTSFGRERIARRLTRIRYWVILVRRCLFLCTKNLGQYASCSSICARALAYSPLSLPVHHGLRGLLASTAAG